MWERIARLILPLRPNEILFPPIASISLLTHAGGDGSVGTPCVRAPVVIATIKRFFSASLSREGRISSHRPVIFRYNNLLYPGRVINSV